MSYTQTATVTRTYTTVDVEKVVRRFTADIVMIAGSTGAITEAEARDYAHDVEALAKAGYLRRVDLTLLSYGAEVSAVTYAVNTFGRRANNEPSRRGEVASRSKTAPSDHPVLFVELRRRCPRGHAEASQGRVGADV